MACRLVGAKPLSAPKLEYCQLALRESILRLLKGGKTTMTTRCAPACSQALPVKPKGVWARGIEAWAGSHDRGNQEFRRWGSSGPSSLMDPQEQNFSEILIEIDVFSFKKMHLKMSSVKCRPFCLSLNVLSYQGYSLHDKVHFLSWCFSYPVRY